MWGSDYPHTDGVWPESSRYIKEQFAGLAPEIVHKITCENAAKFYGLITTNNPSIRRRPSAAAAWTAAEAEGVDDDIRALFRRVLPRHPDRPTREY